MKKLLLIYLFSTLLFSCVDSSKIKETEYKEPKKVFGQGYQGVYIIDIDSCEYILAGQSSGITITHKENCKSRKNEK